MFEIKIAHDQASHVILRDNASVNSSKTEQNGNFASQGFTHSNVSISRAMSRIVCDSARISDFQDLEESEEGEEFEDTLPPDNEYKGSSKNVLPFIDGESNNPGMNLFISENISSQRIIIFL